MANSRGTRFRLRRGLALAAGASVVLGLSGCDPWSLNGPLSGEWTYGTGGPIAAKPAVSNGTVYMGSWNGNEYALDEASGALRWSTYLGVTQAACLSVGVTSSPAVQGGVAYLGGGGSTWDALDTSTGNILWTVPTGDNSPTAGHYNWSSPAIYNGYAYVGIASLCDDPLVQGELLRVNLATHQIDNVFKVVPDGQTGGTIWTNPVVDPSSNTVFVATGNAGGPNQPYAQSVVALDATTLAVKDSWTLPESQAIEDPDFGTSPVLFTNSSGRALVAVTNKNGILYAFDRSHLSAGPVWEVQIAAPDEFCIFGVCGGSFSTGVFDGTRLYFAAGGTIVGGSISGGSVRAIDPDTGAFVWEHALPAQVYGALAQANGLIAVPSNDGGLYVIRASDGAVVNANTLSAGIDGAPTIADGSLFIGTLDGVVHAFTFPASAAASAAASRAAGASCTGARSRGALTARCRLTIPARSRCGRVGEVPSVLGAVALDRVAVQVQGRFARSRSRVRLYLNGSCAGTARMVIRVAGGHGTLRFKRPPELAPGTVASVSASRPLHVRLRVSGRAAQRRHGAAARAAPSRSRPPR